MEKIKVICWYCGKKFEIKKENVTAGQLFCSDKCREENLKMEIKIREKEIELEKKRRRKNK